jgi:hypothetical protein
MAADLPLEALPAWQVYCEMGETKQDHFELLREINERREQGGASPTLAETVRLEALLKRHDLKVKAFRLCIKELLENAPEAHRALVDHLAAENARLGADDKMH